MGQSGLECCKSSSQLPLQGNIEPVELSPEDQSPEPPAKENTPTTLVFIERPATDKAIGQSDTGSTDAGSKRSCSSCGTKNPKAISVLKTAGIGMIVVSPGHLDKTKLARFKDTLQRGGIDISTWGVDGAKSVEHLYWEAYEQRGCLMTGVGTEGKLKRVTRLVKIKILSDIFGVEHALFSRMQFMHDGQCQERQQLPLKKLMWKKSEHFETCPVAFYQEQCEYTEDWRVGYKKGLQERLGLSLAWQEQHLYEDATEYKYHIEDNVKSPGYPGLNTLYCIHTITLRVVDPENAQNIGLPQGQEFATTEGDFNFNGQHDEDGLPIGSQLNIWMWAVDKPHVKEAPPPPPKEAAAKAAPAANAQPVPEKAKAASTEAQQRTIKRVPLPLMTAQALYQMKTRMTNIDSKKFPSAALRSALEGKTTNWDTVQKMARNMMSPSYSLDKFNADLSAFPELNLYLLEKDARGADSCGMSSGRTIGDEYQRTVGAFFAIYWLTRLSIGGKDGFCFGVDDDWKPIKAKAADEKRIFQSEKRLTFHKHGRWDDFKKLLMDAGLLIETRFSLKVNEKRMTALLALTAIHDIMKLEILLPEVQIQHAPYHGYKAGDRIADHDHALAYIMDYYPDLLPSFMDLDADDRRSLQFTQCNLCFNHGWLVQAEAPPGAVFTQFRQCLIRDHQSSISTRDIALYFVHWLTDLAGAEPTPLGGSEKFVIKFPFQVLNSFLRSFEIVEQLADHTETEVMETYLKTRWPEHTPSPGPQPTGPTAIARMRLLCMAQMNATRVLQGFEELNEEDKQLLSVEMARSGCMSQGYSKDLIPQEVYDRPEGPAFLIYYGPAFLQNLGSDSPSQKLAVLAEVYRCARAVWPCFLPKVANTVIIRIDTIKGLSISSILEVANKGEAWILVKHNENEAFIERSSKRKLNKCITNGQTIQILDLSLLGGAKK